MRITPYDFGKIVVDGETHPRDAVIHPGRGGRGAGDRLRQHRRPVRRRRRTHGDRAAAVKVKLMCSSSMSCKLKL